MALSLEDPFTAPVRARRAAHHSPPPASGPAASSFQMEDADEEEAAADDEEESDEALLAEAVPPNWDFFELNPAKLREKKANDVPIIIERIRLQRYDRGQRRGIPGDFDARKVDRAWLLREFGPGDYYVTGINRRGVYVIGSRINVGNNAGQPSALQNPAAWQPTGSQPLLQDQSAFVQEILRASVQNMLRMGAPPAPREDPIKDSVAAALKVMTLNMAQASQREPERPQADPMTMLLMKEILADRREARAQPSGGGSMEEIFKAVTLGMQLKDMIGGGEAPEGPPPWMDIVKTAVDRMGPGAVSLLSHAFLPVEAAGAVDEMIKGHNGGKVIDEP